MLSLISFGLFIFLSIRMVTIQKTMDEVQSLITHIIYNGDNTPLVIIEYTYNDITYTSRSNMYSSSMYEGQFLNIYVDPNHPQNVYQPHIFSHVIMPLMFALIFGSIGFSGLIIHIKKKKKRSKLTSSGKRVIATVTEFKMNMNYVMTTGHKRQYRCHVLCMIVNEFTGIETHFKSSGFWSSTDMGVRPHQSTVNVWIDQTNPKNYLVDLESINI